MVDFALELLQTNVKVTEQLDAGKCLIDLMKIANILLVWLRIRLFISRNLKEVKISMNISFAEKSKCSTLVCTVL